MLLHTLHCKDSPRHKEGPTPNANSAMTPSHPHSHLLGGQGLCGPALCPSGEAGLSLLCLNPLPVLQVAHRQAQPSSEGLVLPPPASQETLLGPHLPETASCHPPFLCFFRPPGPSSQLLPGFSFPKLNSGAPQAQLSPCPSLCLLQRLFPLPQNENPQAHEGRWCLTQNQSQSIC